jgi:hypothetical protein
VSKAAKRRSAEKKQLQEIKMLIEQVQALPDPKIEALIADLLADVLSQPDAASEGLNLQRFCRRVYHFELS